ncbi:hypothetical protein ZIOFF_017280 [Zingiber officinale]|uniref:Uncharacterized protein n=1 Tax=Zingiber officinale TaxID=94328 RepID=A0A8J5LA49_ZINOF|nr:hypothetical protein ZIOFF_017280 [Zingiber officinale]
MKSAMSSRVGDGEIHDAEKICIEESARCEKLVGEKARVGEGEVYPFTVEKISKLREEVENAKKDQTLRSILVSSSHDYLITNDRSKEKLHELSEKVKARLESQTLESLLVSDDLDYVIGKNGLKNVHHAGQPMPGEEQEDIVITSTQNNLLNMKCPLIGKPVT